MTFHRTPQVLLTSLALVLFTLTATAQDYRYDHDEVITDQFTSSSGGTLTIDADFGSITLKGQSGTQIDVRIVKGVNDVSDSHADELFDRYEVSFDESRGGLKIIGEFDRPDRNRWRNNKLRVHYEVMLPRGMDVDLHTAGGSIHVEDVQGEAFLQTSGGSIRMADVNGPVEAKTSGGSIEASNIGGVADFRTSGGSIRLKGIGGKVDAKTSGGTIRMEDVQGSVNARTSGGSIRLAGIVGSVDAQTSGGSIEAEILGMLDDDVRLQTSGGSVTVRLDDEIQADIDAQASGGSVRTDFPVTVVGEMKRTRLKGSINGGGPMLTLRTSGGNVRILEN